MYVYAYRPKKSYFVFNSTGIYHDRTKPLRVHIPAPKRAQSRLASIFLRSRLYTYIHTYNHIDCWTILRTKSTESLRINVELNLITTSLVNLFLYFYVSCIRVIFGDIFWGHMERYRKRNLRRNLVEFSSKSIDQCCTERSPRVSSR